MARILDDSSETLNLECLIQDVLCIMAGRSREDASIALHDNDFNVEKAISALLDEDGGLGTVRGCGGGRG